MREWAGSSKQASELQRREEQRTRCHIVGICFLDHAVNLGANKEDEADEEEAAHQHANKTNRSVTPHRAVLVTHWCCALPKEEVTGC